MFIGNELYSSLSRLYKQTYLLLTELPEIVCVFESNYQLQYSPSHTSTIHAICTLDGFKYCLPFEDATQTLTMQNYISFLFNIGCIIVGIYCIDVGGYKIFISHSRDVYGMAHPQRTCVLRSILSNAMKQPSKYSNRPFSLVHLVFPIQM